jgi:glycerol-3-phosphate dehydrogenase (NAD(P)+)
MIAESISEGGFGMGVAASDNKNAREAVKEIFSGTNVKIEASENPQDVSLSGVLKNIYATLIGITSGIGASENAIGFLAAESIKEMGGILKSVCGNKDSACKTECAGDFLATIFSEHSRNLKTGMEMAKSGTVQKSEGVSSLAPLVKILGADAKDFRLLSALYEIIQNDSDPKTEISKLL